MIVFKFYDIYHIPLNLHVITLLFNRFIMKNILLLTDFSDNAQNALDYALDFFSGSTINFFILNVQKVSKYTTANLMTSSSNSSVYDAVIKDPKARLDQLVQLFKRKYANEIFSFEVICDYDDFVSAVNQTVQIRDIDLIILGTNGATGAREVVLGSNTIHVIRNIDCPALIIPENFKFIKPHTVLFVSNYDEPFVEDSLAPLVDTINRFNSKLDILTLEDNKMDITTSKKNKMNLFFNKIKPSFYNIDNVQTEVAIDCFVQIKSIAITAKIINKKSFFDRLLTGSSTPEITYKTRVPLLVMHP